MDYTTIRNAATKIVDNIKTIGSDISTLQNKQDIISTSDKSIMNSHKGKLKIEEIGGKCEQASTTGKNLMNVTLTSQTVNGVRLTVNDDKTITANGTATADTYFTIGILQAKAGAEYIVSGCPSGGNPLSYGWYYDSSSTNGTPWDYGNENEPFTALATETKRCAIFFKQGAVLSNTIFKPMIRLASIVDDAYEPYTGGQPSPNPDYPQEIKKVVVSEIKTHGKNLLNATLQTTTSNGVTCTNNGDGTYTLNGTATAKTIFIVFYNNNGAFKGKKVKATGSPSGGNDTCYKAWFTDVTVLGDNDLGNGAILTPNTNELRYQIEIASGYTCYNLLFKPMISTDLSATYDDYEPYAESSITLSQPIELYSIGDVKDKIVWKDGALVIERNVTKNQYNFPTPTQQTSDGYWSFGTLFGDILSDLIGRTGDAYKYVLCDKLSVVHQSVETKSGDAAISVYGHVTGVETRARFKAEVYTAEEAEAICDSATFYYACNPSFEALPFTDQIALNSLLTYDAVTYLDFDSEIEPTFKGEYGVTEMGGRVLDDLLTGLNSELLSLNDSERINALESTIVNNIQD